MHAKIADMVSMAFDHIYFFVSREVQLHSQYKSSYHALWSYVSELQFRIIFLVCSVTVLAAILLYCRRLRRMSSTSSLWQYNSSPVLYNVDVIPSTDKIPVRWPNEKKLRRDFEKSDMTIKMFLCKERRRHFVVFWLMWHQPESASDRMSAHAHHPLVLGHANFVPRSCDPFVHHQGSLTSRRIWKNKSYLIGRKTYSSYANYFANYTNCENVDLILTSHLGTHQFYTTVKEKVYLNIISKKHATTTFCQKFLLSCYWKSFNPTF